VIKNVRIQRNWKGARFGVYNITLAKIGVVEIVCCD